MIGFGTIRSRAGEELRTFLEKFQIPFATTLDGKGIIPENHPLALGVFCDSGHDSARKAFQRAEVVLAIGNSFAQHATFNFRDRLFENKTLIHINIDEHEINKVYTADCGITSDAGPAVTALTRELSHTVSDVAPARIEKEPFLDARLKINEPGHINPGQLALSLSKMLPENAIVLADAGAHLAWLGFYLELTRGQNFHKPGSFGPMAWATNGGLGTKIAHPDRTVVVGCGDGCYNLSGFELMTAVQYNIPVIWIIFNDGEFKLIKAFQLSAFHESGLVEFTNPDFVMYAKACGAQGYRVESLKDFERAFGEALRSNRPTIIDAIITRLAIPHYSPSPTGLVAGIKDMIARRLGNQKTM